MQHHCFNGPRGQVWEDGSMRDRDGKFESHVAIAICARCTIRMLTLMSQIEVGLSSTELLDDEHGYEQTL